MNIKEKSKSNKNGIVILFCLCCLLFPDLLLAQTATISEDIQSIKTYMFDEPNPVPILGENSKIYPYFKFEGYEHVPKSRSWKVVTLENDYIKLSVLPQIGGKIWGAIEKKTGEEFLYKNDVVKFRNIAMRGPWTSGGIEFNFGIIGHTPATATPVDYVVKENEDGSVSCIVGAMDLSSRTRWWVEINLQKDKAYFETKAFWYNPTPINQSYYNWMTAAAAAKNDLEFFIPGNQYLKHNGNAEIWPQDEQGRDLSFYKNNNFGPHKSYHIVGDYKDFFGGYYHNTNFGFGHWSPYEEMPGQKLWLWALSRSGGIWEDLLTDTDGQYIEFQAGRLFNQYSPDKERNPISQANFEPYVMDTWKELWFPFKEIGGMVDVSEFGVLNVEHQEDAIYIGLNALQPLKEYIKVLVNGVEVVNQEISMNPMDVFSKTIPAKSSDAVQVVIGDGKLMYSSSLSETLIKRPFHSDSKLQISTTQKLFTAGWEAMKYRVYDEAFEKFEALIEINPSHQEALVKLAELEYRKTNYDAALNYANAALRLDTYNPEANYKAGIIYRAQHDFINALESLGWAARSMEYRSVSYAQMAEIHLSQNNTTNAKSYALKALDFNTYNLNARKVLLVLSRKQKNTEQFKAHVSKLLSIDPLSHFTAYETNLFHGNLDAKLNIQNEFSDESMLELALEYYNMGLTEEAIQVLKSFKYNVKSKLWLAYLLKQKDEKASQQLLEEAIAMPSNFVSPYRREIAPVLKWALNENSHWKLKYYLAQNHLALGLKDKGNALLELCKNEPNSDAFYRFRASTLTDESYDFRLQDYNKALELNYSDWKIWSEVIQFYLKNKKYSDAYMLSQKAFKKFPKNYNIELAHAKTLVYEGKYERSIKLLKKTTVLPSELAMESRRIYFNAHVFLANQHIKERRYTKAIGVLIDSKKWPENLGVGKPYDVDNRVQDYLLAVCYENLKEENNKVKQLNDIIAYTNEHINTSSVNHLFGLLSLNKLKKETEINELLTALEKSVRIQNNNNKLALALFKNDKEELSKLKEENNMSEGLWSLMKSAVDISIKKEKD